MAQQLGPVTRFVFCPRKRIKCVWALPAVAVTVAVNEIAYFIFRDI